MSTDLLGVFTDEILTALRASHTYHDLSGPDQVFDGLQSAPPTLPFVCLVAARIDSDTGPSLAGWQCEVEIEIRGYCSAQNLSTSTRAREARRLASDAIAAVQSAFKDPANQLYSLTRNMSFSVSTLDGNEAGIAKGLGFFLGSISFEYTSQDGI